MLNKELTPRLVLGNGYNPWYNLAVEEYLLEQLSEQEIILYLWQNDNTVVIGRNQNAWQECQIERLREDGGQLARRLSGGGAVFHDLGNLNYTLLVNREDYARKKQLQVILKALQDLGIEAEFSGRNDIVCREKKISGNAFYYGTKGAYIHGTVLVGVDLNKLTSYLQVSNEKISGKGIESIKSRVMNLQELDSELTVARVKNSLRTTFQDIYNQGQTLAAEEVDPKVERLQQLYEEYSAWDWRFGATPDWDISFSNRFSWGGVEINLKLVSGYIKQAVVYSDAMYGDLIEQISNSLEGLPFKLNVIRETVEGKLTEYQFPGRTAGQKLAAEFINWLETELAEIM